MTIYNTLITGSEKQARQGERGFDRRERNYAHHSTRQKDFAKTCADDVTKAKRKFNTVLRSLYEPERCPLKL